MMAQISAALLVGGLGTRLRSIVQDRNKVLAEIHGRPFLSYLLDGLNEVRIGHVVLCTGYKGELIQNELGNRYKNIDLEYSQEPTPLGTGGALALALPRLRSDPVLVMNGDSYCQVDFQQFWDFYHARHANAAIVLKQVADASRFGSVRTDHDDRIVSFDEKDSGQASGWINGGIYLLSQSWLSKIQGTKTISLERDVFPHWTGQEFFGFQSAGPFIDIGTPESLAAAEEFFRELP
jgi:NDP-sugar pyrophosphorylase family protein